MPKKKKTIPKNKVNKAKIDSLKGGVKAKLEKLLQGGSSKLGKNQLNIQVPKLGGGNAATNSAAKTPTKSAAKTAPKPAKKLSAALIGGQDGKMAVAWGYASEVEAVSAALNQYLETNKTISQPPVIVAASGAGYGIGVRAYDDNTNSYYIIAGAASAAVAKTTALNGALKRLPVPGHADYTYTKSWKL